MSGVAFESIVDLARALEEQEQASRDQDEITPRERPAEHLKQRRVEADDPGEHRQQPDPREHRSRQPDAPRAPLLLRRKSPGEDRDENDVVDAEDDLQHRQRDEGDDDFGHEASLSLEESS